MNLQFEQVCMEHVEEAVGLAIQSYEREAEQCGALGKKEYREQLEKKLKVLFAVGNGMVAFDEENTMVGYLAFYELREEYFGRDAGTWSPCFGNAYIGAHRGELASRLFEKVSEELRKKKATSYVIVTYAHDEEILSALTLQGFGIRCSDAIRLVEEPLHIIKNITYEYKEITCDEADALWELHLQLEEHLQRSPTYMPLKIRTKEEWRDTREKENARYFIAKDHKKIIGYMQLKENGETFLSEDQDIVNIGEAYFLKEYRGTLASASLLFFILDTLKQENVRGLGVDCETINPTALRFWKKYFDSYTYSFARRIDERVAERYVSESKE